MIDLDELERLAKAASIGPEHIYTDPRDCNNYKANEEYHKAIYPQYVIELINRLREAEQTNAKLLESLNRLVESQDTYRITIDAAMAKDKDNG